MTLNRNQTDRATAREILRAGLSRRATLREFLDALALYDDSPGYATAKDAADGLRLRDAEAWLRKVAR